MKKLAKESLLIGIFALLQFVLFLSQFNPLLVLLFVPLYTLISKENFIPRIIISYVFASIGLMFMDKTPIVFVYLLIVYIVPVTIYITLKYAKNYILDFSALIVAFLAYQVFMIKAIKSLYKIDIINGLILFLKNMLEEYFKALNEDVLLDKFAEFMKLMVPSFVIIESITFGTVAYYFFKWTAKRLKIEKDFLNFEKLFMPKEVTVGVVVFFILSFFLTQVNLLYIVVSNMIIILLWLLFIQSLSLIYAIITEKISSLFFRGWMMIVIITFSFQILPIMFLIGFLDLVFDFKKRGPKKVKL
ncbi:MULTISPECIES: DUF2232 domain-containing protein [unclassified Caldicellulosiruptor]|uniref:DUF2232 domain-containing protein n=1 Tax=unclassified Caldicellulosiruptor TaxID=2622462 RepID=UPI000584A349|nr:MULTISPECIES: DUF2232 domain-containing protein [unclassified Caldicellulosiruptor]